VIRGDGKEVKNNATDNCVNEGERTKRRCQRSVRRHRGRDCLASLEISQGSAMEKSCRRTTWAQDKVGKKGTIERDVDIATDQRGGSLSYDLGLSPRSGLKQEPKVTT